jgi:hypothetical protein
MVTSQDDSVVLQQWQSALEAAGRRPNTFRSYRSHLTKLRDALEVRNLADAVISDDAHSVMVAMHGDKYSRHTDLIMAARSLCFSVPGCVPKGSATRWEDLYKLYKQDPAKGAACALSTALQSGPERFMDDFAADSVSDQPVDDQLVTLQKAPAHKGGSLPLQPPSQATLMKIADILDAALVDPGTLTPEPLCQTDAAKRSRRKRRNKRAQRSGTAIPPPDTTSCISDLIAAAQELHVPKSLLRIEWTFLAGCWKCNVVDFAALRGRVTALDIRTGDALTSVTEALLLGAGDARSTVLVNASKPARGRGNAPKVRGRLCAGGTVYTLERVYIRRANKERWHQGTVTLSGPTIGPISGESDVKPALGDLHISNPSVRDHALLYSPADQVCPPNSTLKLEQALSTAARTCGSIAVAECDDDRLEREARLAVLRRALSVATEYLGALLPATGARFELPPPGTTVMLHMPSDADIRCVPVECLETPLAQAAVLALRAACPGDMLIIRPPSRLATSEIAAFVARVRSRDPLRGVVIVGGSSELCAACGASGNAVHTRTVGDSDFEISIETQ